MNVYLVILILVAILAIVVILAIATKKRKTLPPDKEDTADVEQVIETQYQKQESEVKKTETAIMDSEGEDLTDLLNVAIREERK